MDTLKSIHNTLGTRLHYGNDNDTDIDNVKRFLRRKPYVSEALYIVLSNYMNEKLDVIGDIETFLTQKEFNFSTQEIFNKFYADTSYKNILEKFNKFIKIYDKYKQPEEVFEASIAVKEEPYFICREAIDNVFSFFNFYMDKKNVEDEMFYKFTSYIYKNLNLYEKIETEIKHESYRELKNKNGIDLDLFYDIMCDFNKKLSREKSISFSTSTYVSPNDLDFDINININKCSLKIEINGIGDNTYVQIFSQEAPYVSTDGVHLIIDNTGSIDFDFNENERYKRYGHGSPRKKLLKCIDIIDYNGKHLFEYILNNIFKALDDCGIKNNFDYGMMIEYINSQK